MSTCWKVTPFTFHFLHEKSMSSRLFLPRQLNRLLTHASSCACVSVRVCVCECVSVEFTGSFAKNEMWNLKPKSRRNYLSHPRGDLVIAIDRSPRWEPRMSAGLTVHVYIRKPLAILLKNDTQDTEECRSSRVKNTPSFPSVVNRLRLKIILITFMGGSPCPAATAPHVVVRYDITMLLFVTWNSFTDDRRGRGKGRWGTPSTAGNHMGKVSFCGPRICVW